ncbi:MAG: lytic murein transglycosylase [Nitrospirae bacterium]|nr:lytic murein transglycosylase [Nitrospirota bacterium]
MIPTHRPRHTAFRIARVLFLIAVMALAGALFLPADRPASAADGEPMNPLERPEYVELLKLLETEHGFAPEQLEAWFGKVTLHEKIPQIFDRPAEAKPYHEYRLLFTGPRIHTLGADYLLENADLLTRVEERTGVPPTVVAAIMGIETKFGSVKGGYHAFDALNSAFALYPQRRAFFQKELVEFLLLCREEQTDPFDFDGSYAGALGMPQFMPSSFRAFAVDFDGDGKRNIWTSHADVAGSIGNYLAQHGWRRGEPLKAEVFLTPEQAARFNGGPKQKIPLAELTAAGIQAPEFARVGGDAQVAVVSYQEADGRERFFVVFDNFLAIMRYNTSVNYAMVAAELDDFFRGAA